MNQLEVVPLNDSTLLGQNVLMVHLHLQEILYVEKEMGAILVVASAFKSTEIILGVMEPSLDLADCFLGAKRNGGS